MTDVRTLLKAKRQEMRISHRYASYSTNGQLRCTACGILIKHASAWEGHLGTKGHRTSVARLKEKEMLMEERRHSKEVEPHDDLSNSKRGLESDYQEGSLPKRTKLEQSTTNVPIDFFSNKARSMSTSDTEANDFDKDSLPATLDVEYERFQREVLTLPDYPETYDRATIVAEPELVSEQSLGGLPSAGPAVTETHLSVERADALEVDKNETEERELILDRLLEEERSQEEADMRVGLMKKRIENVRRRRQGFSMEQDNLSNT
ncbi:hypothetical protein AX17_002385 [Amanita inopinata Kibby_2008]|nr:hypothetical protein AX17_002385 [Amanita inopinata Kibby_2008]